MRPDVDAIELRLFLEAIYARYGYDMRGYSEPSMSRRVQAALARTHTPHLGELQHRVLRDPALFATVLEALTVRVSEMFRDPSFYASFRSHVVPVLKTYPTLKLWHCGCASGEEAYSMAILLGEEGLYERTQIYATDMSAEAIAQAKLAIYPAEHLPRYRENYAAAGGKADFSAYYTEAYGGIAIREALRRNVFFFQHNLVSDHTFGEMHVVSCRNVLIYFGQELRERVMAKFTHSVCAGGFLCLGSAERAREDDGFAPFVPEERIYRLDPR